MSENQDPINTLPSNMARHRQFSGADFGARGNLPSPLVTLIGREVEILAASALLQRDNVRLITFTGPGGVGKTQLALAVARDLSGFFADGVVFVPLAPISDPNLVVAAIAQALEVRDAGERPLLESLNGALRERDILLLLDNFEHVTSAAPLVIDLLSVSPGVKAMVTSRELLHLSGEHVFPVPPLELPDLKQSLSIEELASTDAIRLFVVRAQGNNPDFALTEPNAAAIADICRIVDGLPLAIELAAARSRVLSPLTLLAQMTNRLQILTGGHRDAPERLQTMRSAIAWSYDLLSEHEQRLFRRLSVFVGGFSLDGATSVGADGAVLDHLSSLVEKSLVQKTEQPDGETRFLMLETIRAFGLEHLEASGEAAESSARHAAYCFALAEQADLTPFGSAKEAASKRLNAELFNIRAAMKWAEEQHDIELLLQLPIALVWYWDSVGPHEELYAWLDRAIEATTRVPPRLRGRRAYLLAFGAHEGIWRGEIERAMVLLDESLAVAREVGDARALALVELNFGQLALQDDDWDVAKAHFAEALARWRALSEPQWIVETLYRLGLVTGLRGEREESEVWFAECLEEARARGWSGQVAYALEALGTCARERGDYRQAAVLFAQALTLARNHSDPGILALSVRSLGAVAAAIGKAEQAVRLFGAAEAARERYGFGKLPAFERLREERFVAPARDTLPSDVFAAAWTAGRKLPINQAIAEALEVARAVTSEPPLSHETQDGLTPRELDVLRLVVEGLSDKEIGDALGISRRTASKYVETILAKLDVPSRTAAATYATRHGLI
jgi:predicted ATPase/DNA-binding CsgD family transcriptional regulator